MIGNRGRRASRAALVLLAGLGLAVSSWAVGTTPSKTTLVASPSPAMLQHNVTLTATVAPASGSGATPSGGTVSFAEGATAIPSSTCPGNVVGGVATCTISFTTTGTHTLAAKYSGDATYATSSGSVNEGVTLVSTTTTLVTSPNPTKLGSPTTFTATVSGTNPAGTVTFYSYGTSIGSAPLSGGTATMTYTYATVGSRPVYAAYSGGDGVNAASQSAPQTQSIMSPTSVAMAASPASAAQGQSVALTATVTGVNPSQNVTFNDVTPGAAASWGPVPVASGKASTTATFSVPGMHTLTATYSGDANNYGNVSSGIQVVINATTGSATTATVTPSTATPTIGSPMTLTATVTGGATTPTGSVAFLDGGTLLSGCPSALSSGTAVCTWTPTSVGTHSITVDYAGDGTHAGSVSKASVLTVGKAVPRVLVVPSANPVQAGSSLTLVARITGYNLDGTGQVQFMDGSSLLGGLITASGAQAVTTVTPGTVAGHAYSAQFKGDSRNTPATSPVVVVNVAGARTVTSVSASAAAATPSTSLTFTASVAGSSPTGQVVFRDGAGTPQTVVMSGGSATWTTTLPNGLHTISANYLGDATNAPSAAMPVLVQVTPSGTTPPAGAALQLNYQYDAQGNLTQVVDANAATTTQTYDSLSRNTTITQPVPATGASAPVISLGYDLQDQPTSVSDPRKVPTTYTTDGLGNTTQVVSRDTGTTTNTYYDSGLLWTTKDARNRTATYTYDALDRVKTITYDSGVGTTFGYDAGTYGKGHLTSLVDESGNTQWVFDGLGRPTSRTQVVGPSAKSFKVSYTYDGPGTGAGKLATMTYPSGVVVQYGYDGAGRLSSISVTGTDGVVTQVLGGVAYTGNNQPLSWIWGVGNVVYQRSYDGYGRLSTYPLGNPSGTGVAAGVTRTLAYDAAGRIVGYSHTTPTNWDQVFGYDGLDRLTAVTNNGANNYSYNYDASGNRTGWTVGGTNYTASVDPASNRLASVSAPFGGTLGYDNAGHLGSDANGIYSYSARGRMSSATRASVTVSYLYNGLEQRVYKSGSTVPTGAAYFAYDEQGRLIGEYDASGNPIYETVYFGDIPVASLTQPSVGHTTVSFIYADHLNTARVIVRPSDQGILWTWGSSEAFGQAQANPNPKGLGTYTYNLRFPGQVMDAEAGWFYNWNRDYNPALGRYIQSDPIGLAGGSISTYGFVGGSPLMAMDVDGLVIFPISNGGYSCLGCHHDFFPHTPVPPRPAPVPPALTKGETPNCPPSDDEKEKRRQYCADLYDSIMKDCRAERNAAKREECYIAAAKTEAKCLKGMD